MVGKNFMGLSYDTKNTSNKRKKNKLDFIRIKNFYAKEDLTKVKRPTAWEKIHTCKSHV